MSIWSRISEALASLAKGEGLAAVLEKLRTPPERSVAFTIAVIALGAKMAKADGRVTRDEVRAFRAVFHIPKAEESQAARVFDLARQDVAGYESYASQVFRMFGAGSPILSDLLEGLFYISIADGTYHPKENQFLERIAEIFQIPEVAFRNIRARFVPEETPDPYSVLGVSATSSFDEVRKAWRGLVRECHPDAMIARGLPEEAVKLAEKRLIAINNAYDEILENHG
jgi:DnaJ like chaperone protein